MSLRAPRTREHNEHQETKENTEMKALIGLCETDGQIAALYVHSLEARPPLSSPGEVLQAWSASPEQLRRLLETSRVERLSGHQITFREESSGVAARFRGANMFEGETSFWREAAARHCELAAICKNALGGWKESADWRILWPWAEGARERGELALQQLTRADVKLRAAQTIFTQSRDEPGRRGRGGRAAARQTIESVHAQCAEQQRALLRDALESMGAPAEHRLAEELVAALRRAAGSRQHVEVTENALAEAERLIGILTQALRKRVDYGAQAAAHRPDWVPGRPRDENGRSADVPPRRLHDASLLPEAGEHVTSAVGS